MNIKLYSLRALGRQELPEQIEAGGISYHKVSTVKHDFFAATGFYEDAQGKKAVLKMGRTIGFWGLPAQWVGKWLCRRELRFYSTLADLPNVPGVIGTVGKTGFVHEYVEGMPLSRTRPVPNGFFRELHGLMEELHKRGIAYVDTNKPENILLGDDGRPHLIDFQISWDGQTLGRNFLSKWVLKKLQREDRYHILKHHRRMRLDEMTAEEIAASRRKSGAIRIHRIVTRPYFIIRRMIFKWLHARGWLLAEGSK